jgi:two-component system, OmpR family, sensor histidine kinase ChvG
VIGVLAALLLGYASWLSWRVRRLSRAAAGALGPHGELRAAMPGARRGDELGDLARAFEQLLDRVAGYTRYLQGLGGRLSHEFRTPLAVISSSLESLAAPSTADADRRAWLERAREGTARLQAILARLSEATHAERMVDASPRERYDPAPVVESCARAYRDLHRDHRIEWRIDTGSARVDGHPDLLAQALDKLVDNAVEFTPPGGRIAIGLRRDGTALELTVDNEGSRLPDDADGRLFDSLVSVREGAGTGTHLGLGLYLVRLIARFHGGRAEALNLPGGAGVRIRLHLPAATD